MTTAVTVTAINVYPVKACGQVETQTATVGPYGLVGDREWQVITPDGGFLTQRQHRELARVRPRLVDRGIRPTVDGMPGIEVEEPTTADRTAQGYFGSVPG